MTHWLRVGASFGRFLILFGGLMTAPALAAWAAGDGLAGVYLACGGATAAAGLALVFGGRGGRADLSARHGFLLVALIWTIAPLIAALPLLFILDGARASVDIGFSAAVFEAASGLTATGATALSGLDELPPSINFWRGEMSWIGGMGLIVLAAAILPFLGVGGRQMFLTEIPGPIKEAKLTPQIAQTAKALWAIYSGLTALCALAYRAAGMNWLDAVVHAFTTLSLGGFSSHDKSFAYFDSPAIEAVAVFFMVIAGMNFATHFAALSRRAPRTYLFDIECRAYLALLGGAVLAVFLFLLWREVYGDWAEALRRAIFNTVSIATTTGYSTVNYAAWPLAAPLLMLLLANFTACGGSTGGGAKLMRAMIACSQSTAERSKLIHPTAYYDTKFGHRPLPAKIVSSVLFFLLAYIALIFALTLFLTATGMDFLTAFSAASASVSNTGPGLGEVGPASNYSHLTLAQTWACAFAMLIGRLEIFAFLVVFSREFWRY